MLPEWKRRLIGKGRKKKKEKVVELCVACGRPCVNSKGGRFRVRGRCKNCYWTGLKHVRAGLTTWEFIESVGFALPLQKGEEDE